MKVDFDRITPPIGHSTCKKCSIKKSKDHFYLRTDTRSDPVCKECRKAGRRLKDDIIFEGEKRSSVEANNKASSTLLNASTDLRYILTDNSTLILSDVEVTHLVDWFRTLKSIRDKQLKP